MAQLVERLVRNEKASGSNPLISTTQRTAVSRLFFCVVEISITLVRLVRTPLTDGLDGHSPA